VSLLPSLLNVFARLEGVVALTALDWIEPRQGARWS